VKIQAESGGQNFEVVLKREGETLTATVDGREYQLTAKNSSGEYLLFESSRVHNAHVDGNLSKLDYVVELGGSRYQIRLRDPKRLSASNSAGAHHHGSAEIVASMPGKVVRVLVETGAEVKAGAGIVVVEAMKMQNEMKAPKAGTIIKLNAVPGSTVNAGDVLAVIE
jgi:biotin carboxyl carrier protein